MTQTFDLEVTFGGLVGLVPNKASDDTSPAPDHLLVLAYLKNGLTDRRLPRTIPPHVSCVVVPQECLVDPDESGADIEFGKPGGAQAQLFVLSHELVRFDYASGRTTLTAPDTVLSEEHRTPDDDGAPPPTDLAWMPSLERTGTKNAGVFDERLLAENLAPSTVADYNRLAATVRVCRGKLETTGVVKNGHRPVVFDFKDRGGRVRFRQSMFSGLKLTDTLSERRLDVVLTREGGQSRCIQLQANERNVVELCVLNLELESIMGVGEPTNPETADEDLDFAIGYFLSLAWDDLQPEEVVVPHSPAMGPGGSGPACRKPKYKGLG